MPSTVQKIIDPDGTPGVTCDYLNIAAWVADNCGVPDGDFSGEDKIGKAVCRCTGGTADTTNWTFPDSWNTSATCYPWIYVDPDYRPYAVYPATGNLFRIDRTATGASQKVGQIEVNYARFDGLYIKVNAVYDTYFFNVDSQIAGGSDIRFEKCLLKGNVTGSTNFVRGIRVNSANAVVKVGATVLHNMDTGDTSCVGIHLVAGTIYAHRVTTYGCRLGYNRAGGTFVVRGCIAQAYTSANGGFDGTFDSASDYNCSEDTGDAPGSNSVVGEVAFVNAAGGDFRLAASDSVATAAGEDLSADTQYPISEDLLSNNIFRDPPDIGACEHIAGVVDITAPLPTMDILAANTDIHIATVEITAPLPTMEIDCEVLHTARVDIVVPLPICNITTELYAPEAPEEYAGFETWPDELIGGLPEFEGWEYKTLITPPETGRVETSDRDDRPKRQWTLRWRKDSRLLDANAVEILRAFARDHVGPCKPFYFRRTLPIPRPYNEPTLGLIQAGTLAEHTVRVGYTWVGDDGETTISIETDTIAVPFGHLLTVTVPKFPTNVYKANIYVGTQEGLLYRQELAIPQSGGTWTEPSAGYSTSGANPPTTNTLTETVLAQFKAQGYRLTQVTGVGWEAEVYLQEYHQTIQRTYYASVGITAPLPTMDIQATAPVIVDVTITAPLPTMDITATYEKVAPPQTGAEVDITVPLPTVEVGTTLGPPGNWYVAKTGSDGNPGSYQYPFLTIQKALNVASPGHVIIIQPGTYQQQLQLAKPDLTLRGVGSVIVDANGAVNALTSGGVSNRCVFDTLKFKGGARTISSTGDTDWRLIDCEIYDATQEGLRLEDGLRHRVIRPYIHDIGPDNEAMGIHLEDSDNCIIDSGIFELIRKNGIRDKKGNANSITRNFFQAIGTAIAIHDDTNDTWVENNYGYYLASYGVVAKRFGTGGVGYIEILHNTWEEVADNCFALFQSPRYDGAKADYIRIRLNLLKCSSGSNFVLYDSSNAGTHVVINQDMYWALNGGPLHYWEWQGNPDQTADSVAEIYSKFGYEQNGSEYNAGTVGNYGASGYPTPTRLWVPLALTAIDASRNVANAYKSTDWTVNTYWDSDGVSTNQWIIYDLGSQQQFEYAYHQAYSDADPWTVKNIKVQTSNSASGPWDDRVTDEVRDGGSPTWWQFSAPVTARYIRFYIYDNYGHEDIRVPCFGVGNMI